MHVLPRPRAAEEGASVQTDRRGDACLQVEEHDRVLPRAARGMRAFLCHLMLSGEGSACQGQQAVHPICSRRARDCQRPDDCWRLHPV